MPDTLRPSGSPARRPWDIIGYLVDRLADEDRNTEARTFWREFKAEAMKHEKDGRAMARYRDASRKIISGLRRLPTAQREAREQTLWNALIEPFGAHLDPGEYEQVRTALQQAVRGMAKTLGVTYGSGALEGRLRG